MNSVAKGNQWFFGMRCHIGVDADSGLVHSVVSTAANVHELNTAVERVHGEEGVSYGDSGHIGIEKRDGFKGYGAQMRIAMKPGQRRVLPDTQGRLKVCPGSSWRCFQHWVRSAGLRAPNARNLLHRSRSARTG